MKRVLLSAAVAATFAAGALSANDTVVNNGQVGVGYFYNSGTFSADFVIVKLSNDSALSIGFELRENVNKASVTYAKNIFEFRVGGVNAEISTDKKCVGGTCLPNYTPAPGHNPNPPDWRDRKEANAIFGGLGVTLPVTKKVSLSFDVDAGKDYIFGKSTFNVPLNFEKTLLKIGAAAEKIDNETAHKSAIVQFIKVF